MPESKTPDRGENAARKNPAGRGAGGANRAEFIGRLVRDPANPPEMLLLNGFLGDSSERDHTRLYFDPELSDYVDIPNDAILDTRALPEEESPLGESLVWIQRDATLIHGRAGGERMRAKFLEGPIFQEFQMGQQALGGAQFGGAGFEPLHHHFPPPTLLPSCPTRIQWLCPTRISWQCPTRIPQFCPQTLTGPRCITLSGPLCRTDFGPNCPPQTFTGPRCPVLSVVQVCQTQNLACQSIVCPPQTFAGPRCPVVSAVQICQTQNLACQSLACPTSPIQCQTQACPSALYQCPTLACPSAVDACPSAPGGCGFPGGYPGGFPGGFPGGGGFIR